MGSSKQRVGIAHWPEAERPRERLLAHGASSLSDAQLLAILLRVGRQRSSALQIGLEVLDRLNGLSGLAHCGIEELCAIPGVGTAKAAQLKAAIELGKRVLAAPLATGTKITSSRDLFHHYHPSLRDLRHEIFKVVLLDAKHAILRDATVSKGSLTLSIVHPREVFNLAVRESAAAVIFLHNHPSGDPTPSPEDRTLTSRLVAAGEVLGIRVLDHLIVGDGRYVSFADQGRLTCPTTGPEVQKE
ncbi:MAG TPA: DNA repair protein RadC [Nitrospiraceae bacterium]|nr:DNA repair protein RadC [Nitrospiraceae bacterium]